ncbi:MAG TPA: response regulator [Candidatus Bathyarchaeia archaeon]|nr:response regulator [Candidatus Bathyarchaeia archaeon]
MSAGLVRVLLVGSGARGAVALQDHLVGHGCSVRTAPTLKDAADCLGAQRFAVVLSELFLPDGSGYDLIPLLLGTDVTLFFSDNMRSSCWWMRVISGGVDSSHKPGMSPEKFRVLLNEIVFDEMLDGEVCRS